MDEMTGFERVPPHNTTVERALIGAAWQYESVWEQVADRVSAADFYNQAHRQLWAVMAELAAASKPLDVVSVMDALQGGGALDAVGGMPVLLEIDAAAGAAYNAGHYADAVREQAVLRQLIATCTEIQDRAFAGSTEALEMAANRFAAMAEQGQRSGPRDARALLTDAVSYLDELFTRGCDLLGVPTGFVDLDAKLSGLQPGELYLLAGRPSMGKSIMAQNVADHVAMTAQQPVVFFSLEMSARSLMLRSISAHARVEHGAVRRARLGDEDWPRITQAVSEGARANLYIDDSSGLTVGDLVVRARRLHREHGGLALVVVDYLQLLSAPGGRGENRNIEVMRISQALKGLSKTLNCPVLALSQLNRGLEQRPNKRPLMADLRDSGGLEQDADVVLFVYRDEVYHEHSDEAGTAEIIIGKHRNGETGMVRLMFDGAHCAFRNLAPEWAPARRAAVASGAGEEY